MFDETQNAAEVIPEIADKTCRGVGGDDNQRNAESILVVALGQRQNDWRLVIVPAAAANFERRVSSCRRSAVCE